jgi:hypothetical protein
MTTRTDPRISVNKLSEYLQATAGRRRRLVQEQKTPATFQVNWYAFAQSVIPSFIIGGCSDETILTAEIARLGQITPANEYEESRNRTNGDAITAFLESYDQLGLEDYQFSASHPNPQKLLVAGVQISVRPEVHVTATDSRTQNQYLGCLKLYFSKDTPLTDNSGQNTSTLLYQFANAYLTRPNMPAKQKACLTIDVFGQKAFSAPHSTTRRIADITAACQEINLLWQSI